MVMMDTEVLKKILRVDQVAAGGADIFADNHNGKGKQMHDNLEQGSYGKYGMPTSPIYSVKVQSQPKYIVCPTPSSQNSAVQTNPEAP